MRYEPWEEEHDSREWDAQARLTRRVVRRTLVFLPVWIVLLGVLGSIGGARFGVFAISTILAAVVMVMAEVLWLIPRERRGGRRGP